MQIESIQVKLAEIRQPFDDRSHFNENVVPLAAKLEII